MNRNRIILAFTALAMAMACSVKPAEPVSYTLPEINVPLPEGELSASVGDTLKLKAEIVSGDRVSCGWYLNGRIESSSTELEYVFTEPGEYLVAFVAKNGAGEVSKAFHAIVDDVFDVELTVKDSLCIYRTHLNPLNVGVVVRRGRDVKHSWKVDDEEYEDVDFLSVTIDSVKQYNVHYHGENAVGSMDRDFTVLVLERPLEVSFSIVDHDVTAKKNQVFSITANALYGGTGLRHKWAVDDEDVSTEATLKWTPTEAGTYTLSYFGENAKGETVSRTWTVKVVVVGLVIDDFEGNALKTWWRTGQNSPGNTLADNPDKTGINTSDKCLKDNVAGEGSTSGYFDLLGSKLSEGGVDVTKYSGIRMKVYLGGNKYYPRIQVNGTKFAPVKAPRFNGGWEELEYNFGVYLTAGKDITFRLLLKEDGSNISGYNQDTNNRTVYIDDIELID